MKTRWNRIIRFWWLVLLVLGVGLRLAYVLVASKSELGWGDELTYDQLARNMAAGYGYCFVPGQPSLLRAPLYPILLAGLYAAFGHHYLVVLIVQALIGGATVPLLAWLGRKLGLDLWAALIAGLFLAFHPLLIFAAGLLYSETIYLFLLLLFTLTCLQMASGAGHWGWAVLSGLLLGASVLMKPNLMLLPPMLFLWLWWMHRSLRRALLLSALVVLAMGVVVLPWTWRNYRISGALVPVSANSGVNLWQGNHPEADGAAYPLDKVDPLPEYSEVERDQTYRQWALQEIRAHPGQFLARIPAKLQKFLAPLETSNRGRFPIRFGIVIDVAWGVFLAFAVWGGVRTLSRSPQWILIYLLIGYPIALTVVFYGGTRYGMVTYPYLFLLAAEPLSWLWQRVRSWRKSAAVTTG